MAEKSAFLISIGDELLSGKTANTNASYIAKQLAASGFRMKGMVTVKDDMHEIIKAMGNTADLVVMTGGLGPTPDDITVEAVSRALRRDAVLNHDLFKKVRKKMRSGSVDLQLKQSVVMKDAELLDNKVGIAPGEIIDEGGRRFLLLPGVPSEMKYLLDLYLKKHAPAKTKQYIIRTYGIFESELAQKINEKLDSSTACRISYLPSYGHVDIVLYNEKFNEHELRNAYNRLRRLLSEYTAGRGPTDIASEVGKQLRKMKKTLSTAESCTGGLIAEMITDVPGSSDYYLGGITAYSNMMKRDMLKVKKSTIDKYGAVSRETAAEMAENIRMISGSDYSISVTGIAGPGGGTKDKPVGLVYCGISAGNTTEIVEFRFKGRRESVRKQTASFILHRLLRRLYE